MQGKQQNITGSQSPPGLLETSLQVRQFSEMPSCDVFIFSNNTLDLLINFFLNVRKSC